MSKTIETLKRPSLKEDVLYTHIADTYFHQKTRSKSRKKKTSFIVKHLTKTVIVFFVLCASIGFVITTISVMQARYMRFVENKVNGSKIINVVTAGAPNREVIKHIEFRGHAKNRDSKIAKDAIVLNNPKKYNSADLSFDFKFPLDFSSRQLLLTLRGNVGGERVNIVLRDKNNRSLRLANIYLSSNWKDEVIRMDSIKRSIDLSRINHIRVECGYAGESSKDADSLINFMIYIKNIGIVKEA